MTDERVEAALDEIQGHVDELVVQYEQFREGGFRVHEIIQFALQAGSRLVDVVQDLEGLSGPQKKQTVMIAVKDIYGQVNPDVPLIPEPFETWLEDFVLDKVLGVFIDYFVRSKKEKQADPS